MTRPGPAYRRQSALSVLRCLGVGVSLGAVWMIISLFVLSNPSDGVVNAMYMLSYVVDTLMVYSVVAASTLIGLSVHNWGTFVWTVRRSFRRLLNGFLAAAAINLFLSVFVRYFSVTTGTTFNSAGLIGLNLAVSTTIGYMVAYRAYCIVSVLDKWAMDQYKVFLAMRSKVARIIGIFIPFVGRDRYKASVPPLVGIFTVVLALGGASTLLVPFNLQYLIPLVFSAITAITIGSICVITRALDSFKTDQGERPDLFPYWEPLDSLTA